MRELKPFKQAMSALKMKSRPLLEIIAKEHTKLRKYNTVAQHYYPLFLQLQQYNRASPESVFAAYTHALHLTNGSEDKAKTLQTIHGILNEQKVQEHSKQKILSYITSTNPTVKAQEEDTKLFADLDRLEMISDPITINTLTDLRFADGMQRHALRHVLRYWQKEGVFQSYPGGRTLRGETFEYHAQRNILHLQERLQLSPLKEKQHI